MKDARRLTRRRERAERRLFLAEGAKALSEALEVPGCVVEVFATRAAVATYPALRAAVTDAGLPWHECGEDAVAALSGTVTPQGLVAVCRALDVDSDEVLGEGSGPPGSGQTVVCADVRDPGNAGTIIRTADAVGAIGVVLAGESVDLYNPKTVRATVGSLFHLPLAVADDPVSLVEDLRATGHLVLAADGGGETDLFDAGRRDLLSGRVAWLFGNEAHGLPADLAALADWRVAIPIRGRAESLNLATAAAVCLYATLYAQTR